RHPSRTGLSAVLVDAFDDQIKQVNWSAFRRHSTLACGGVTHAEIEGMQVRSRERGAGPDLKARMRGEAPPIDHDQCTASYRLRLIPAIVETNIGRSQCRASQPFARWPP